MKESTFTGKYIFETIKRVESEVDELEKALDVISEEIGQGSLPYNVVNNQRLEAVKKLKQLYNANYEMKQNGGFIA